MKIGRHLCLFALLGVMLALTIFLWRLSSEVMLQGMIGWHEKDVLRALGAPDRVYRDVQAMQHHLHGRGSARPIDHEAWVYHRGSERAVIYIDGNGIVQGVYVVD